MTADKKLTGILERALGGIAATREETTYMFSLCETSLEAGLIRAVSDSVYRKKVSNSAVLLAQIGIDISKCPGGCRFCSFGDKHTHFEPVSLSDEELTAKAKSLAAGGDLYALYLMTMHDYDLSRLLHAVEVAKKAVPGTTRIWINMGDADQEVFEALKERGVDGIYHVCRLREGTDTNLDPKNRQKTMDNVLAAGLKLATCLEPIGPEHTPEEFTEQLFIGVERHIYQHAAMRRVAVPGTPLAHYGQISELRLAQLTAIVGLACLNIPDFAFLGVHEPNKPGFLAGANAIFAESGGNPRDINGETSEGRGMDMDACRKMMLECGFTSIQLGDGTLVPLDMDYINEKARQHEQFVC